MPSVYFIPKQSHQAELEIKKSRFIARAIPIEDRDAALRQVAAAKAEHPESRHVCWAYLLGHPSAASNAAMNDDGEPSGTAGKPILNVIQHKQIGDVLVLVIRYFGGIKLGAGGLVRAYGGAAERVLSELALSEKRPQGLYTLSCAFSQEQHIRHWLSQHQASIENLEYQEQVQLLIRLELNHSHLLEAFCSAHGIGCQALESQ